nr:hypothetical protein [Campylobacter sp.]
MKNGINDKEVNLENTNKHTKMQKLFSSKLFQVLFFIFLSLLIFDSFQILFSSIESMFYITDFADYQNRIGKVAVANGYKPNILFSCYEYFSPIVLNIAEEREKSGINPNIFGLVGLFFILTALLLIILLLSSTIIVFKQTKNFILKNTNFGFSFYILLFICIYSICLTIVININLTPIGHRFAIKDFSIYKMLICIIIALISTFAFKKLINFTLKDKK